MDRSIDKVALLKDKFKQFAATLEGESKEPLQNAMDKLKVASEARRLGLL